MEITARQVVLMVFLVVSVVFMLVVFNCEQTDQQQAASRVCVSATGPRAALVNFIFKKLKNSSALRGRQWSGSDLQLDQSGPPHTGARQLMRSTNNVNQGSLERQSVLQSMHQNTGHKVHVSDHDFKLKYPLHMHGPPACMRNNTPPSFQGAFRKIESLHDPKYPVHGIRKGYNWTWSDVQNSISKAPGHSWCSLVRDNWSCSGERYARVLRSTKPFQQEFGLQNLRSNLFIFAEGNSYLAQLILSLFCWSSVAMEVWQGPRGNDYFARVAAVNLSFLLIDNDKTFQKSEATYKQLLQLVKQLCGQPDIAILGAVNFAPSNVTNNRTKWYEEAFPGAILMPQPGRKHQTCWADSQDCSPKGRDHLCLPGPGLRAAEALMKKMKECLSTSSSTKLHKCNLESRAGRSTTKKQQQGKKGKRETAGNGGKNSKERKGSNSGKRKTDDETEQISGGKDQISRER
eukprot:3187481-Rhodomonas_salina.2